MPHNPLRVNSIIDSCAFNPHEAEAQSARKVLELADRGEVILVVAHSTKKEIDHPHTPADVRQRALDRIVTLNVDLTPQELRTKEDILTILAGDGNRDRMKADAEHVFEAQKYGGYFITTDDRILAKADVLHRTYGVHIVRPSEFVAAVESALRRSARTRN